MRKLTVKVSIHIDIPGYITPDTPHPVYVVYAQEAINKINKALSLEEGKVTLTGWDPYMELKVEDVDENDPNRPKVVKIEYITFKRVPPPTSDPPKSKG